MRNRQRPKRESSYSTSYIVDDDQKHFEYGKERHAQPASGPPHQKLCALSGIFRFGKRYDSGRHFNVSLSSGLIGGSFDDCHDAAVGITARTHINMFPNDFAV
jgi:hypothetical protein